MPTLFTHALLPVLGRAAVGRRSIPVRLALLGAALAMLPDFDVIGFRFGIAYDSQWGHRGASHSLFFAGLVAALTALAWKPARSWLAWLFLFASAASHGLLDMMTDGGRGVALLWPFDATRYALPWRPIRVSPIGARFFTARGLETVMSELLLVWVPVLAAIWLLGRLRRSA